MSVRIGVICFLAFGLDLNQSHANVTAFAYGSDYPGSSSQPEQQRQCQGRIAGTCFVRYSEHRRVGEVTHCGKPRWAASGRGPYGSLRASGDGNIAAGASANETGPPPIIAAHELNEIPTLVPTAWG